MNERDELGTQLTRTLTEHADVMSGSSLGLAEVKVRATSIRRRRTATAVVGVAAAVAVIIPTAALATHTGGSPEPAPAVTRTPSPTTTSSADSGQQPRPGVLEVSDLPSGDAPHLAYVTAGSVLHQADGSTVDIGTRHPVSSFAVLKDGSRVWQTADDQGHAYVEIQDAGGAYHAPVPSTFGLSASRSHDAAAWVRPNGQVTVFTAGAAGPRPLGDPVPVDGGPRISAFGQDDCTPDYCSVFVNVPQDNGPGQPWEVADHATRPFADGGLVSLADVGGSVIIGRTELTDLGSCSKLFGGGEFQGFHTCRATLMSFAPDGSTLLGFLPYWDALGSTSISMWDLEGHQLFERSADPKHQAVIADAQWEDASHVIALAFQENTWSLVRIASDGTMEYAVPPVTGGDVDNPFVLETT